MKNKKTTRLITVARKIESRVGKLAVVPHLRIAGRWFEKAGFQVGDIVEVDVQQGCLMVRRTKNVWKIERRVEVEKYMVDDEGKRVK